MATVWDHDGNAHERLSVDAAEMVASGIYFWAPPATAPDAIDPAAPAPEAAPADAPEPGTQPAGPRKKS